MYILLSAVAAIGKGHVKWCPCDEFAGYSEVKQRSEPQLETRVPDRSVGRAFDWHVGGRGSRLSSSSWEHCLIE